MPGFKTWMLFKNDKPATNAIVVATREEAEEAGRELMSRWYVPTGWEVRETDEEPNYYFDYNQYKLMDIHLRDPATCNNTRSAGDSLSS